MEVCTGIMEFSFMIVEIICLDSTVLEDLEELDINIEIGDIEDLKKERKVLSNS